MNFEFSDTYPAYLVGNDSAESRDAYELWREVRLLCLREFMGAPPYDANGALRLLVHHARHCLATAPNESVTDVADRMVADAERLLAEYERTHRAKYSVTVTETRSRTVVLDCPAHCGERSAECRVEEGGAE